MSELPAFEHSFRVRYAETDQMGVVHNSVYLIWFEIGRTELCIQQEFPYSLIEDRGIILVVAESRVRYKRPAYYDNMITISTRLASKSARVIKFEYQLFQDGKNGNRELIAEGWTTHVPLDKNTNRATRMPADIMAKLIG